MTENTVMSSFRKIKIIQLISFFVLELIFFIILITNDALKSKVFTYSGLFTLCFITWTLFLLILLTLFYDVYALRNIHTSNHELQQLAYLDNKTGIPNRTSLDMIFRSYSTEESIQNVGCCLFAIENLNTINDSFGRETGDKVIQHFCTILEEIGDTHGFVGRNGGNEFIIVINNCTSELIDKLYANLDRRLLLYNQENPSTPIHLKRAYSLNSVEKHSSFLHLLTSTYTKLL